MAIILIIKEPSPYFSQKDEDHFFYWLQSLEAVTNVVGTPNGIEITLQNVDKESLYELIAIMTRYGLDKKCLASLCTHENEAWFKDKNKYWYASIFGS
jgi:hypothetical protein